MAAPTPRLDVLAALMRAERVDLSDWSNADLEQLFADAIYNGALPFVADRLRDRSGNVPLAFAERAREIAAADTAADLLRERELVELLRTFHEAGVVPLLFKGAQLAYSHYPRPDLRARIDSDMLIDPTAKSACEKVLAEAGYERTGQITGDLVTYQALYAKRDRGHVRHAVDLHWRISNPQVFAGVLTYPELAAVAVPLPRLSPYARGLSNVHALLLACVHRVAHHYESDRLKWLYDIHLVARQLSASDWSQFVALAADRKVAAVCRRSLDDANQRFPTALPSIVQLDPRMVATGELSASYLQHRRHVQAVADDLRALPTWRARLHLVREHIFPPAAYMRNVYAPQSRAPLALLYVRRLLRGTRKWLARADDSSPPKSQNARN